MYLTNFPCEHVRKDNARKREEGDIPEAVSKVSLVNYIE